MSTRFNVKSFNVAKFDRILARGLSHGLGQRGGQVCIEAAICETLGLDHGDDPQCVAEAVRTFKIQLNDSPWSSAEARAKGLRDLGLAQLGSKGVVNGAEFTAKLAEKTIRRLIPKLFRQVFPTDEACLAAAQRCETEGTSQAAEAAEAAARAASAGRWTAAAEARAAATEAREAAAAEEASAGRWAAAAARAAAANAAAAAEAAEAAAGDEYLILSAQLALETLRELKSPGCELL